MFEEGGGASAGALVATGFSLVPGDGVGIACVLVGEIGWWAGVDRSGDTSLL